MTERMTAKSEKFTLNLFECMTQRQSYKDAYNPSYPVAHIDEQASRLAATCKVSTRLAELREKASSPTVALVKERKERLTTIVRADIPPNTVTPKNIISASDQLNKMEGIYSPETQVLTDIKIILVRRDPK